MKRVPLTIILILLLSLSESCRDDYMISNSQELLFQMDYVNFAWGYQHYGFMIDNKGRILTYRNPEKWNFPDNNLILSEEQAAENISMCRIAGTVDQEELKKYSSYIGNIASGKISAMRNVAADAGTIQFICYNFSDDSRFYKGSLIKLEGDFSAENLNFYSKKVVSWLKEIEGTLESY